MASSRSLHLCAANAVPAAIAEAHGVRLGRIGTARHPHLEALLEGARPDAGRDLADAVHLLCHLHGRHPGLIELALGHIGHPCADAWLGEAADAFERERLYLVRLTAAVGPLPSTPGAAETEASLMAQRNALEILASSERNGCALGAVTALVGDWGSIRRLLDRAAVRTGIDRPEPSLPDEAAVIELVERSADVAGSRAVAFGGEQLLLQHRALFDLLEARASARADWDS